MHEPRACIPRTVKEIATCAPIAMEGVQRNEASPGDEHRDRKLLGGANRTIRHFSNERVVNDLNAISRLM
jgi:hypothetical protein